ncbi:mitochondrial inner membrane protein OXA1-like [Gossypium arboreum]|uniref:mitochondrial inner membrane protein OXA1-like n=1 Tax=Gossypium arboreum TaxID=29729 RepID=UPI0022F1769A|nr:mitochondrial inner membrane protein OXA1-like [Gossypium arboreum]
MAFRRSLCNRVTIMARRYQPSFAYVLHEDDRKNQPSNEFQSHKKPAFLPSPGMSFYRHMSTTGIDKPDKFELIGDVVDVLKDTAVEAVASQAPAVNEVAVAGADCWLPVASLQYVIDAVHSFTGLNWWASIAVTTLLIRGATLPLLINELKATTKMTVCNFTCFCFIFLPSLSFFSGVLFRLYPLSILCVALMSICKTLFLCFLVIFEELSISFVYANMYPQFNNLTDIFDNRRGKCTFFLDDIKIWNNVTVYIFLFFNRIYLICLQCNMQDGMEGKPASATKKIVSSVLAILTVPFTMNFPKAIFCYWITSNLFSISYGLVLKGPGVKKALGIPKIPDQPAATARRTSINPYSVLKKTLQQARTAAEEESASVSAAPTKLSNRSTPSSSAINQRIKPLEKQVKGKKNNKKR